MSGGVYGHELNNHVHQRLVAYHWTIEPLGKVALLGRHSSHQVHSRKENYYRDAFHGVSLQGVELAGIAQKQNG